MRSFKQIALPVVLLVASSLATHAGSFWSRSRADYEHDIRPLIDQYCYACHGMKKQKAGVALNSFNTPDDIRKNWRTWLHALERIQSKEMPPADEDQPTKAEREKILRWLREDMFPVDAKNPDPGRVTIRRLNRTEYNDTIHDLLGIDFKPADDFPADDLGYGFDNIGDALSLSPMLMEKYLSAAGKAIDRATVSAVRAPVKKIAAAQLKSKDDACRLDGDRFGLYRDGAAYVEGPVDATGLYRFRIRAYGERAGNELPKMAARIDGTEIARFDVGAEEDAPQVYEFKTRVTAGKHRFAVAYLNNFRDPENINPRLRDRNLFVNDIEMEGPLDAALPDKSTPRRIFAADKLDLRDGGRFNGGCCAELFQSGAVAIRPDVAKEGTYLVRVLAYADQAGSEPAKMTLRLDGRDVQTFEVNATEEAAAYYEFRTDFVPGSHRIAAAFINDFWDPNVADPRKRDRNLYVQAMEIVGPVVATAPVKNEIPEPYRRLFVAQPDATHSTNDALRAVIEAFANRAFRRPVTVNEQLRLNTLAQMVLKNGGSFEEAAKVAFEAILVSPHFLFRGEVQPQPDNPKAVFPVSDYDLASRLSYFLWSTMPDDALFDQAGKGTLRKNLDAEVGRMLKDEKSHAFVENFAGQWLQIRNLIDVSPDTKQFTEFDEDLRQSMRRETELFFENVLREDRSVLDFLTADYSFVNERLAKLYGIAGVTGPEFRRVSLKGTPRGGVFTQASILTITSNPTRTSPVKRGKWILDNVLNAPPPPPPPEIPPLPEKVGNMKASMRQRVEEHRTTPVCASCHIQMDDLGFAFEHYDAIGRWREKDEEFAIDDNGEFANGDKFAGASGLRQVIAQKRSDQFVHCLAEKMLTYALGRGLEYYDMPTVDRICANAAKADYRFSALVLEVVKSAPFQMRRGGNAVAEFAGK